MANTWKPNDYAQNARFVATLGLPVVDLLGEIEGLDVLDLGCGDGVLTEELIRRGAKTTGVDSSEAMVTAARSRGIDARVMDATALTWDKAFDAVFTNATLHWVKPPEAAIGGVARALRPGGRFVGEFGGHGNVAAIVTALSAVLERHGIPARERNPWFYPTATYYSELLEAGGFSVDSIEIIPRPTPLPTDMGGWLKTFAGPFVRGLSDAEAQALLQETTDLLSISLRDEKGNWTADYIRLRFVATLRTTHVQ